MSVKTRMFTQVPSFLCDEANQPKLQTERLELCRETPWITAGIETHQAKVTAEMRLGLNELMASERDKDKEHYT